MPKAVALSQTLAWRGLRSVYALPLMLEAALLFPFGLMGAITLSWPVHGPLLRRFDDTRNKGIDIGGNPGEPVRAAASGRVVYAGNGLRGYGNLVIVKSDAAFLKGAHITLKRRTASASGDFAWVGSESEIHAMKGKEMLMIASTETMVLRKTDQGWKIAHIHWSSRRAGGDH